jgi:hypothetical protein
MAPTRAADVKIAIDVPNMHLPAIPVSDEQEQDALPRIVVVVSGGVVQGVYCDEPVEYAVVDFDNIEAGDEFEGFGPTEPWDDMDHEVRVALGCAFPDGDLTDGAYKALLRHGGGADEPTFTCAACEQVKPLSLRDPVDEDTCEECERRAARPSFGVVTNPLGGPDVVVPVCPFTHDENGEVCNVNCYLESNDEAKPIRVGDRVVISHGVDSGGNRTFAYAEGCSPLSCRADAWDYYREKLGAQEAEVMP